MATEAFQDERFLPKKGFGGKEKYFEAFQSLDTLRTILKEFFFFSWIFVSEVKLFSSVSIQVSIFTFWK
jgi:hypothetical protein